MDRREESVRGFTPPTASCKRQKRNVPSESALIKSGVHLSPKIATVAAIQPFLVSLSTLLTTATTDLPAIFDIASLYILIYSKKLCTQTTDPPLVCTLFQLRK